MTFSNLFFFLNVTALFEAFMLFALMVESDGLNWGKK